MNRLPNWIGYVLNTSFWGSLSFGSSFFDRDARLQHACMRHWSLLSLRLAGAEVIGDGFEHITPDAPQLLFSNHEGPLDIVVLGGHLPVRFRWLAKQSLFKIPFLGGHLRRSGHIPIDRSRHDRALQSLDDAARRVREGRSVLVFPEGTRSGGGGLLPFKKGVFHLAIQAQVPAVPIAIAGSGRVLVPRSLTINPGRIRLRVGQPIATAGLTPADVPVLMERVRAAIQGMLDDLRKEEEAASA